MNHNLVKNVRDHLINLISLLTNVPKEALEDEFNFEVCDSMVKTSENAGFIGISIDVNKMMVDIILNNYE